MDKETQRDQVFRALSDGNRRRIVALLSEGARSVGDIQARFAISQPAVSQHLKVLRECGLVSERRDGRRRIYDLEGNALRAAQAWLDEHVDYWAARLDALGHHLRRKHGPDA